MEFLLSLNYGSVILEDTASQQYLSVMVNESTHENFKWGGCITMNEQRKLEHGIFSFFKTNGAYRNINEHNWIYTDNNSTLLCYVKDLIVYVIIGEDRKPVLVKKDYSGFEKVETKVTNNVIYLNIKSKCLN